MSLRDYQIEALEASRANLLAGIWSQVLVLPTGSGKTYVFAHLAMALRDWLGQFPRQRILILAHREELLEQAANHLRDINPSLMVGVEQGDLRAGPLDDVVIASVGTLTAAGARRLQALNPDEFQIIVVDEAHHSAAASYQKILRHFNAIPPDGLRPTREKMNDPLALAAGRQACQAWWAAQGAPRLLVGVTATPKRADGIGLEWTYQSVVYEKTLRWMVERGYLVPPRGFVVDTSTDLDAVHTVAGDFNQGELATAVNTPERNAMAVAAWKLRARNKHGIVRPTLAFVVDIQHARDVAMAFQVAGVKADWASGQRREAVEAFRAGEIDVLASCDLVTEGFDHPPAGIALMLRPTKSHTLYAQQVGRVLRLAPLKYDALIMDVVDVTRRHALVAASDLFGLPEKFNAEGRSLVAAVARIEAIQQRLPDLAIADARTLGDIERRLERVDLWQIRESPTVAAHAKLAWVADSPTLYHLSLPRKADSGALVVSNDRLLLQQDLLGQWIAQYVDGDSSVATSIATAPNLPAAFAAAESWVATLRPDVYQMKDRDARWRARKPSPKQIELLQELGAVVDYAKLTRGVASNLLDQYFAARELSGAAKR